jgi:tRNA(Ile)-lysidine synthase
VRGRIIRPLIEVSRKEIEDYLEENGIEYRLDESNLKLDYLRNRVRHQLIPLLLEQNEKFRENILNTITLISDDDIFLDNAAEEAFKKIAHQTDDDITFDYSKLSKLSFAIQRRVIRRAIEILKGNLREIEFKHIDLILGEMEQGRYVQIDLPGGIVALNEYGNLVFTLRDEFKAGSLSKIELKIPGVTTIPSLGVEISAKLEEPTKVDLSAILNREKAFLDFEKLELPLSVRTRLSGDRFIPLGMSNEKKLHDFFVDKKISKRKRDKIPVVESQGRIVWIGRMVIDERAKVTDQTKKILVLEIKSK